MHFGESEWELLRAISLSRVESVSVCWCANMYARVCVSLRVRGPVCGYACMCVCVHVRVGT